MGKVNNTTGCAGVVPLPLVAIPSTAGFSEKLLLLTHRSTPHRGFAPDFFRDPSRNLVHNVYTQPRSSVHAVYTPVHKVYTVHIVYMCACCGAKPLNLCNCVSLRGGLSCPQLGACVVSFA